MLKLVFGYFFHNDMFPQIRCKCFEGNGICYKIWCSLVENTFIGILLVLNISAKLNNLLAQQCHKTCQNQTRQMLWGTTDVRIIEENLKSVFYTRFF